MSLRGVAAIVGVGELKPTTNPEGMTTLGMAARVTSQALNDAGLKITDIDGLLVAPDTIESPLMWGGLVAEYLGIRANYVDIVDLGGATAAAMVWRDAAAIKAGICHTVLCITSDLWDVDRFYNNFVHRLSTEAQYELPYGPMGVNSGYAMIARRHMHLYGTTPEQLAKVAVDQRINACHNPDALYGDKPLTIEDVLSSPLVADPLHLLEIVRPCSGASAVIVTGRERAADCASKPVYLLGAGEHVTHSSIIYSPDITTSPIKQSAGRAFAMAGLTPGDMDLLSLYDCYTITVIISLEDAGFCAKGEGGPFVEHNDLTFRGNLPCNTHGGQLSWGQPGLAGGMSHVTEAVRQLRGNCGDRQVRNARLALVNGNGGVMSDEVTLILGREVY